MPKILCKDISLYYEIHGSGFPIIFIGGFSADHTVWANVIDFFTNKYQVILLDNRGAGQSDTPAGPYTIEQMAKDIIHLCEALNIKEAHFVGSSMGGFIVQTLAFYYPKLVRSATISHSASHIATPFHYFAEAQLELRKAHAPYASLLKASCAWAFSYQFLSQPGMLSGLIDIGLQNPNRFSIQGYEAQYKALEAFDARPWCHKIEAPTLVLSSDQDLIIPAALAQELAQKIPEAEYFCFSSCGHLPQLECPKLFSQIILQFIDKVEKT